MLWTPLTAQEKAFVLIWFVDGDDDGNMLQHDQKHSHWAHQLRLDQIRYRW